MQKQEFILEVCRNGVHAPTAGYIFENIREIQLLKERVDALEARLDAKEENQILDEKKKITKKPIENVKSVLKAK